MRPDQDRVTGLVEAEARALLGYFTRRLDGSSDAADLLGETLLVIWRRVNALPADPVEARMWMYGVAARVLSQHRRAGTRRTALTERLRIELQDTGGHEPETALAVRAALRSLDPVDAEIIRLVHWEGFTQAQVATILGKRPGTIRSRYHRARGQLHKLLSNDADERQHDPDQSALIPQRPQPAAPLAARGSECDQIDQARGSIPSSLLLGRGAEHGSDPPRRGRFEPAQKRSP